MNNALKSVPVLNTNSESMYSKILPLNANFSTFGEAFYSWVNSDGIDDDKGMNQTMVKAFCHANQRPFTAFQSENFMQNHQYFSATEWITKYLIKNNYHRIGNADFYMLDECKRPIAMVNIGSHQLHNLNISYVGDESVGKTLHQFIHDNTASDDRVEDKPQFYEVVVGGSSMFERGGDDLTLIQGTIENERSAMLEYYPFLDGGVNALFEDFLNSDESVLILMGPPGTGKTSAVVSLVNTMNILPIYGKRTEATIHKNFTNFIFKTSDRYMAQVAGTAAKERTNLFTERKLLDDEFWINSFNNSVNKTEAKQEPRIPMIVVEDADILLAPRSSGNIAMAELLNETDGVSSNHDRKVVFITNLSKRSDIDEALMRTGRCYEVVEFRLLTPTEAIAARKASGLPDFEEVPTKDMSLADALRKPRKRIFVKNGKIGVGFNVQH